MTTKSFFQELQNLLHRYPMLPSTIMNSENSMYGDKLFFCKNMFFSFDDANCTDGMYVYDSYMSPNCLDCDYVVESELCYESVDAFKCFNGTFLENCGRCRDINYSYNCINCHDVFGCVNLQNKAFCIFNRQLTEDEYKRQVEKYKQMPMEKVLSYVEQLKKSYPLTQTNEAHNQNSSYGNWVAFSKDCYLCFDTGHSESCAYTYDSFYNKMCYDATYAAQNNQLSYEIVDSGNLFNCNYAVSSQNCSDSSYIFNCLNVKDSLGCVSLQNKQYCVLNRQLTKEQYEDVKKSLFDIIKEERIGWDNLQITS
jgi:hypothetical protein